MIMAKRSKVEPQMPARPVPWDRYTDGQWWTLTRGTDFEQEPRNACRAARQWATGHGLRCNATVKSEKQIEIRFLRIPVRRASRAAKV
jgi:hypothetical protein